MKLEVTITDSRVKDRGTYLPNPRRENYTRTATETEGSAQVIAGVLRAIADEIDHGGLREISEHFGVTE